MRIHYLQHVPFENPGTILDWARTKGHFVSSNLVYQDQRFPGQDDFDWLLIMGGPMNVDEEAQYPWLAKEKRFIGESIAGGKVVLGICLGAQLIAEVIGGKVTRNPVVEIGWFPIHWSEEAMASPLFSFFPRQTRVFQWHGDTFSSLPAEAVLLAESEACRHQAFIYKRRVVGFQFHLENTAEIVENLLNNCADEMQPGPYVESAEKILANSGYFGETNQWMDTFLTRLETMERKGEL